MSIVAERLSGVSLGEPQMYKNLALFPLISDEKVEPHYQLLDEALSQGCARVTEISESGSVPELKFINECDRPVLLLDGEELVGAKQNRIVNLTVLAPAHKTIVIPVSCVEAGRWHAESDEFTSAKRAHYATGRACKAAHVTNSLRTVGSRCSDQSEVWANISEKAERMDAFSDTGAAEALYKTYQDSLDNYHKAFSAIDKQAGALFLINGEAVGLDLFDSPQTLASQLPKLVQSYALDAIDAGQTGPVTDTTHAEKFVEEVANAVVERFPAVGEGEELRLRADALSGGALVAERRIIHLCAFRMQDTRYTSVDGEGSRLIRASLRRRVRFYE